MVEEARPQRLDDMQLVTMLSDVRDLLLASVPRETRQAVLSALVTLVTSQLEHMAASREQVLELVSGHDVPEDLLLRVRLWVGRDRVCSLCCLLHHGLWEDVRRLIWGTLLDLLRFV